LLVSVQFGNLNAVKICLENGATIDEIIETDSNRNGTAVHVAASQGSLEILKLMAEKQPDLFSEVIHTQDSLGMTPLHRAAMFDHVDVCSFLISEGSDIDALDKDKVRKLNSI
jgi:transient receptor potential cation channel subfamily A member 1